MKKRRNLAALTVLMIGLGICLGLLVFEYFLYSNIISWIILFSIVGLLLFSFATALDICEKSEGITRMLYEFGLAMSKPFQPLIKELKLDSLLVCGVLFGFIGSLVYLEVKDMGIFMLLSLLPISYARAFLTYQKFNEFR